LQQRKKVFANYPELTRSIVESIMKPILPNQAIVVNILPGKGPAVVNVPDPPHERNLCPYRLK